MTVKKTAARYRKDLDYEVPGPKLLIKQPTENGCWAACFCMLRSWKSSASYTIEQALQKVKSSVGPKDRYLEVFRRDNGLSIDMSTQFVRDAGLRAGPYGNFLDEGWLDLLKNHGLLWISQKKGPLDAGRHSRILVGIRRQKDKTTFKLIDPSLLGYVDQDIEEFFRLYERSGGGVDPYAQIRHF